MKNFCKYPKKYPYSELFWSTFSRIRTEYGEICSITPNTDTFYALGYLQKSFINNKCYIIDYINPLNASVVLI